MGLAKYLRSAWKQPKKNLQDLHKQRLILFRKQPATIKVDYPTRLDKARSLGYKAKQGVVVVRQRVPRGGYRKEVGLGGRKPKKSGGQKVVGKSMRWIAEERSVKKYPNMEVLNSYFVGEDGMYKWYEVILVDRSHPGIKKDAHLKFITQKHNKRRVNRGLTSAAKKSRGLRRKGKGAEKIRPSARANKGRVK